MGRCICKLDGMYFEWSSIVDAPVTRGMTLEQLREHIRFREGQIGIDALPARLERVELTGTSMQGYASVTETVCTNRAGFGETNLPRSGFIALLRGAPDAPPPMGVKMPDDDDERDKFDAEWWEKN